MPHCAVLLYNLSHDVAQCAASKMDIIIITFDVHYFISFTLTSSHLLNLLLLHLLRVALEHKPAILLRTWTLVIVSGFVHKLTISLLSANQKNILNFVLQNIEEEKKSQERYFSVAFI